MNNNTKLEFEFDKDEGKVYISDGGGIIGNLDKIETEKLFFELKNYFSEKID